VNEEFQVPSAEEIQSEMRRVKYHSQFRQVLKSTFGTVLVIAALAVLIASIFLPVLQVTGTSMQPNFAPGNILVAWKTTEYKPGDVTCFYYNNKIIIKRVIALGGDMVSIDDDGRVIVNNRMLEEPYVLQYAYGLCDLEFPYEVPLDHLFVLGDMRETSVDSRSEEFGCIPTEETLGKIVLRVWPANELSYYGF
jgi:signal peptidase I